jgi:hypothetical protein
VGIHIMVSGKTDTLEQFISKKMQEHQKAQPTKKEEPKTAIEHLKDWNGAKGGKIGGKGFLNG